MLKPSIACLLHRSLFPRPRQGDPTTFASHINRNLVPEVRIETEKYYGVLDCLEAQYPGLDYSYPPHQRRLARFPWHKKLFCAFDELGLTKEEILSLCQWEGTKSAKDKYERDVGRVIRDTTMDGIAPADEIRPPTALPNPDLRNWRTEAQSAQANRALVEDGLESAAGQASNLVGIARSNSYEGTINARQRSAADARTGGEGWLVVDEQWEQWLREAMERNELDVNEMLEAIRQGRPFPISPSHVLDASVNPPSLTLAASVAQSNLSASRPSLASTSHPAEVPVSETASGPAPSVASPPPAAPASSMNDTQIAMVNVWNLGNEIVRNVNAGNAAVVAPASATPTTATTAAAQPAGEAR